MLTTAKRAVAAMKTTLPILFLALAIFAAVILSQKLPHWPVTAAGMAAYLAAVLAGAESAFVHRHITIRRRPPNSNGLQL
jgi:hypothetical protein